MGCVQEKTWKFEYEKLESWQFQIWKLFQQLNSSNSNGKRPFTFEMIAPIKYFNGNLFVWFLINITSVLLLHGDNFHAFALNQVLNLLRKENILLQIFESSGRYSPYVISCTHRIETARINYSARTFLTRFWFSVFAFRAKTKRWTAHLLSSWNLNFVRMVGLPKTRYLGNCIVLCYVSLFRNTFYIVSHLFSCRDFESPVLESDTE